MSQKATERISQRYVGHILRYYRNKITLVLI